MSGCWWLRWPFPPEGPPSPLPLRRPGGSPAPAPATTGPAVVALFPDPVADGDREEFVLLDAPPGTRLGRYELTDGEAAVALHNRTVAGRVALSADPAAARNLTDATVVAVDLPGLANSGERVALFRDGAAVSVVRYRDAEEGAVFRRSGNRWRWRPFWVTAYEPFHTGPTKADLFVLPDSPEAAFGVLRSADRRLLVAGYTLSSRRVANLLVVAHRRSVEVRVLLSGAWYVRDENRRTAERLNRLADSEGIPLTARLAEPGGRFEKIHTKAAVVDGHRVVLGSLNWNGAAAASNRETVLVLEGSGVASYYGEVFRADWERRPGGGRRLPLPAGVLGALGVAVLAALVLARRIQFGRLSP